MISADYKPILPRLRTGRIGGLANLSQRRENPPSVSKVIWQSGKFENRLILEKFVSWPSNECVVSKYERLCRDF
jgi:hypothetical protein